MLGETYCGLRGLDIYRVYDIVNIATIHNGISALKRMRGKVDRAESI